MINIQPIVPKTPEVKAIRSALIGERIVHTDTSFVEARLDIWTYLAARLQVSRELVKAWVYVLAYEGSIDPWVKYLLNQELSRCGNINKSE